MATSIPIRFAELSDLDSLRAMLLAERADYERVVANGDLSSFMNTPIKAILVAADAGTVIAAIFIEHDDPVTTLNGLCVRLADRRQGIGRAMIERAISEARLKNNPREIVAFIDADDPNQRRRFEAFGFIEVTDPDQIAAIGLDRNRLMMVLKLPPP